MPSMLLAAAAAASGTFSEEFQPRTLAPQKRAVFDASFASAKSQGATAQRQEAAALSAGASGWVLDPRLEHSSECPPGQRSAAEEECVSAVQEATQREGMQVSIRASELTRVDRGKAGNVPFGCSYRVDIQRAVFNSNPAGATLPEHPGRSGTSHNIRLVCIDSASASPSPRSSAPPSHSPLAPSAPSPSPSPSLRSPASASASASEVSEKATGATDASEEALKAANAMNEEIEAAKAAKAAEAAAEERKEAVEAEAAEAAKAAEDATAAAQDVTIADEFFEGSRISGGSLDYPCSQGGGQPYEDTGYAVVKTRGDGIGSHILTLTLALALTLTLTLIPTLTLALTLTQTLALTRTPAQTMTP